MPNTNAPFGFRPIRRLDGAAASGGFSQAKVANADGNALNRGDVVQQLATGYVTRSAAGITTGQNRGVFIGCHYLSAALGYPIWTNYWPGAGALGDIDVFIIDDPLAIFEARASAGPITQADIGGTLDVVVAASITGFSAWSLGVPGTTATFPFRVVAIGNNGVNVGDGYDATAAYNIVEVGWNSQIFRQTAGI
jgi:hypothetical protein